jgi:hypothetical protein
MKMKTGLYFLFAIILAQSCATYQKTPVALSEAYDRGKVKVIDKAGTHKYDNIVNKEEVYYGVKTEEVRSGYFVEKKDKIDTLSTTSFYLTKRAIYRVWLSLNNQSTKLEGVLYDVKDSTILISTSLELADYNTKNIKPTEIPVRSIEKIKIRRRNNIGRNAGLGAVGGLLAGGLLGLIGSGTDEPGGIISFSKGETILITGAIFAVPMGIIGAIVGSSKQKIIINGNIEDYNKIKYQLKEYSINK